MAMAACYLVILVLVCSVWPCVAGVTRSNDVVALQGLLRTWQVTAAALDKWSLDADADPCAGSGWKGVVCSAQTQSVISLDLSGANLSGAIPTAIEGLEDLVILDLSGNPLLTSSIPRQIGHLRRLTFLNLSGCNFSGKVPQEIYNLDKLEYLDLSSNPHLPLDGDAQQRINLSTPQQFIAFSHRRLLQTNSNKNTRTALPLFLTYIALGAVGLVGIIIFTFCFCRYRSVRKTRGDVYLMTPSPSLTTLPSKPASRLTVHVANGRGADLADVDPRH